MKSKLTNLSSIGLLILSVLVFGLLFQPQISTKQGKTTIKTSAVTFYLSSISPTKFLAFNPANNSLNQVLTTDTKNTNATFGVYIKNLNTKQQSTLNSTEQFNSASLYKLFVMYTIYEKGVKGGLDINKPDIQQNLKAMITLSDNEAAYYLVNNYTSWEEITEKMHQIGLNNTDLNQDPPLTTPEDVGKLLELIANGQAVNFDTSIQMLELMTEQTRRDRIPALLPNQALIANKTGELDDVLHDAAVVGTEKSDYVIILMTKDSTDLDQTRQSMAKISGDVYNYFNTQWNQIPKIL